MRRVVVWDSSCTFCRRWVRLFRLLDWLRVHRFVGSADPGAFADPRITPDDAQRALQLLGRDLRCEGFDAVRRILGACPATFWMTPVLALSPVRRWGVRKYADVAARRTCALPARH